jgi:hypothetical protein
MWKSPVLVDGGDQGYPEGTSPFNLETRQKDWVLKRGSCALWSF